MCLLIHRAKCLFFVFLWLDSISIFSCVSHSRCASSLMRTRSRAISSISRSVSAEVGAWRAIRSERLRASSIFFFMGSSASKLRTGERGDVTGGLLPVEGDRNSKGWGDRGEFLEMLGRLLEGLKEVRFIPFDVFSFCMLVDASKRRSAPCLTSFCLR